MVTGILRLRSTLTDMTSRVLVSNSSQAPRLGMSLPMHSSRPEAGSSSVVKYTPGERTSCETTTRSAPLMMNVPLSVMSGKSPMKMSCSLISPAFSPDLILSRMRTLRGAANVTSCSRHSSSLIFGWPNV